MPSPAGPAIATASPAPPAAVAPATAAPLRRLGRRPVLDGLRGVAILLVMLMHTGLLAKGWIGVDVFFGLSGFLITTLLYEEWDRTGEISLRRFYERRARRLLPALALLVGAVALLYIVLHPFTGWTLGPRVLTTLLFANNWVATFNHPAATGVLSPTWSLAMEDQFYLLWPGLLMLMLRRRMRPGAVLGVLAVTIVALVAVVPSLERVIPSYDLYYSPPDRAAELLIGCAAAIIWRHRFVPRALTWPTTPWILTAAFVALLLTGQVPNVWVYMGAVLLAVPVMLHLIMRERSLLARLIGCRFLRYVGRISYGLYLSNLLVHNLLVHYLPGCSIGVYAALTFAGAFLAAAASWHLLEARILARGRMPDKPAPRQVPRRPRLQPAR